MRVLSVYLRQVGAAIRVSFADRANFWLQLGGMTVNNGFILLMWFLFFAGFRSVGGWQLADVALMIGILAFTVGVAGVFAGGYRDMAAAILRDEVATLLTQPRAVLPRLLARESIASAWGDVIVGVILLANFAALDGWICRCWCSHWPAAWRYSWQPAFCLRALPSGFGARAASPATWWIS